MEVNYFGVLAVTQAFLPLIRANKGRIINVRFEISVMNCEEINL